MSTWKDSLIAVCIAVIVFTLGLWAGSRRTETESVKTLPPMTVLPASRTTGVAIPVQSAVIPPVPCATQVEKLRLEVADLKWNRDNAYQAYTDLSAKVAAIQTANDVGQLLGEYPEFLLLVLDKELDATARGEEPKGSFSDYFVPIIDTASEAGVSQAEINKRIDRLAKLTKEGKFLSTSLRGRSPEELDRLFASLKKKPLVVQWGGGHDTH